LMIGLMGAAFLTDSGPSKESDKLFLTTVIIAFIIGIPAFINALSALLIPIKGYIGYSIQWASNLINIIIGSLFLLLAVIALVTFEFVIALVTIILGLLFVVPCFWNIFTFTKKDIRDYYLR
jgi:hypothetical protein